MSEASKSSFELPKPSVRVVVEKVTSLKSWTLQQFLKDGKDVNSKDFKGVTPLGYAVGPYLGGVLAGATLTTLLLPELRASATVCSVRSCLSRAT